MSCRLKRHCNRKHTPIESEQQRKFFGAVASGTAYNPPEGLSKQEAMEHLEEVKGKHLPKRSRLRRKR